MKEIDYRKYIEYVNSLQCEIVCLKSELGKYMEKAGMKSKLYIADSLTHAMRKALAISKENDTILISPGAAYFYSSFIKDNLSIKRILTSLAQEEQK